MESGKHVGMAVPRSPKIHSGDDIFLNRLLAVKPVQLSSSLSLLVERSMIHKEYTS